MPSEGAPGQNNRTSWLGHGVEELVNMSPEGRQALGLSAEVVTREQIAEFIKTNEPPKGNY